jgi:hypothetical protein
MHTLEKYVPLNQLVKDKETHWTFTNIGYEYHEIASRGIVMWCMEHIEGRWTMLGGNKFGFESAEDALRFRIQFGIGS